MEVCILAEGCYPYIAGGVSSWINQLISQLKHIDFKVLSIMPSRYEHTEIKYPMHPNLKEIKTVYLQDFRLIDPTPREIDLDLEENEIVQIKKFLRFEEETDWNTIADTICNKDKIGNSVEFLYSKLFWNLLLDFYKDSYEIEGFNHFYWNIRSMFLFFLTIMQSDIPKADVYHSVSTGYCGLLGLIAQRKFNKPFVLTEHGIYAREREEDILKANWVSGIYKDLWIKFFYFISKGAYRSADTVIALFTKNKELQISYGANKENTFVIPNGVNIEKYSTVKKEHDGLHIGAILRFVPIKDVKTLIRSFKIVKKSIDNVKLYLMGPYDEDIDYYNECKLLIENLELENDVIITGRINVLEYINLMDVLVLSSISEAQPIVILEGMASAVPFVSTDVGACKELLEGREDDDLGIAGYVVPPVSPNLLAEKVVEVLNDEKLREYMGKVGRKRVEKYYKNEYLINYYQVIYERYELDKMEV